MVRPTPMQGSRGTPRTRQMQRNFFTHLLDLTESLTASQGAELLGLKEDDLRNLRRGNMPSLTHLVEVVRTTRYTPESLLGKGPLKKLAPRVSVQGAQTRLIRARVAAIAKEQAPAELAERAGIPISTIYRFRCKGTWIGFHVFSAFVAAGYRPGELLLGE